MFQASDSDIQKEFSIPIRPVPSIQEHFMQMKHLIFNVSRYCFII